jgi:hypothetical protein
VEFTPDNSKIYSIELAHLLFAAAPEVDVIAKLLCKQLDPQQDPSNIDGYTPIITNGIPSVSTRRRVLTRRRCNPARLAKRLSPRS